jgi:carbamoyl-phosphate synthase large subunit
MPKDPHIQSILILGSGPIEIGQACEFDYAGVQACLALKEEGVRIILINSNPASVMTDRDMADKTYIEPLTPDVVEQVIEKERPSALLATMGGQTALNLALALDRMGVLQKYQVRLLHTSVDTIIKAEDRRAFFLAMQAAGLAVPRSFFIENQKQLESLFAELPLPLLARTSFSLGGSGSTFLHTKDDLIQYAHRAFARAEPITLDEALIGWREFEIEVVKDHHDNYVAVCTIENIDPMGVHTGDSITVSPAMTLTDQEFQLMRRKAFAAVCATGLQSGAANVQFAIHPLTRRQLIIEMNPRVSRSSALASKVTGYPIARVAAKLSLGYRLDEICAIASKGSLPASFEPSLDYVAVKIPYFQFEKFPHVKDRLTTTMQSVGEVLGIGKSFSEALLKAMESIGRQNDASFDLHPSSQRLGNLFQALRQKIDVSHIAQQTHIDPWFIQEIEGIVTHETHATWSKEGLFALKKKGFSDRAIGHLFQRGEALIKEMRRNWHISPSYLVADGCSGEWPTKASTYYSTYGVLCEHRHSAKQVVVIVGSGANRIGQGIEFDYCCVHAARAVKNLGYDVVMINCNPETLSTDDHISDRLYIAPITIEYVLDIIEKENPIGVLLQYGGQTAINLARALEAYHIPLLGMPYRAITNCEDRQLFRLMIQKLGLNQPKNFSITAQESLPEKIDFPLILRPSFVLGGQGMKIVRDEKMLTQTLSPLFALSPYPVLVEEYVEGALEVDVDLVFDGHKIIFIQLLEHVEPAGVHSGDAALFFPTIHIEPKMVSTIHFFAEKIARALGVIGLLNMQFLIKGDSVYVLEVNPRASRSVPFISKAHAQDLVALSIRAIFHMSVSAIPSCAEGLFFVKEATLPTQIFGAIDLGPEMKSTGEVLGIGVTFAEAYEKALTAAGCCKGHGGAYPLRALQDLAEMSKV